MKRAGADSVPSPAQQRLPPARRFYNGDRPPSFQGPSMARLLTFGLAAACAFAAGRLPVHPGRHQPHASAPRPRTRARKADIAASQVTTIGVNAYLWRAALDTLVLRAARPDRFERRRDRHRMVCEPAKPVRAGQGDRHHPRSRPARRRAARHRRAADATRAASGSTRRSPPPPCSGSRRSSSPAPATCGAPAIAG